MLEIIYHAWGINKLDYFLKAARDLQPTLQPLSSAKTHKSLLHKNFLFLSNEHTTFNVFTLLYKHVPFTEIELIE